MPLKKGDVKSSSKKPLKKEGVKPSSKKPLKKEGVKPSSKKQLKKGGGLQTLIERLKKPQYPQYPQDPQDPDYVKPSPLKRSMLSNIHSPQNLPLEKPQSALDHVHQTRGTLKTLLDSLKKKKTLLNSFEEKNK